MVKKFSVTGMTCSACSAGIEKSVKKLDGVQSVTVSLMLKEMSVDYDESLLTQAQIIGAVEKLGYGIDDNLTPTGGRLDEAKKLKKRFLVSLLFLIPLMYFSMGAMFNLPAFSSKVNFIIQWILSTLIIILNFKFYSGGIKAVINGSPNMDTLVALGSFSAYTYSVIVTITAFFGENVTHTFFEASAMVLALVTLGKWLEEISKVKTGDAIDRLNKLMPKTATIMKDGKMITVLTREIQVGDTVVLRVGDYVAVDGVIVEGRGSVDKSAITGESLPVEAKEDDFISSGSIVKEGFLLVEAINVGQETMFSKIVEMVKSSGASKAPIQRVADKIAGIFVPAVTAIALITFLLWWILGGDLYRAFNFGISVLVISCPCSLGLATPVCIMATSGVGASNGILFKDAGAIQSASKIDCVLLDKTATITVGKPKVTDFINYSKLKDSEVFEIVSALEVKSSHPLASCIVDFCGQSDKQVGNFEYIISKGLVGSVDNATYYMGNDKLLKDDLSLKINVESQEFLGKTVLYLATKKEVLALFAVADYLKEDSIRAINALKKMGIKTVMITGDNASVAKKVAIEVGIDEFRAEVLPQDKFDAISEYKEKGHFVAMVGDGINDSPALKRADLGIAMGNGTDVAIDSSDIIIVNGSLDGVRKAVELSKKSNRIIKQNLFWAFIYNALSMPVAGGALSFVGITLTPVIASVCMSLSSIFVVTNALRISKKKKDKKIKKVKGKGKKHITYRLKIDGMTCNHCKSKVEKVLSSLDNVNEVSVDLKNNSATVATSDTVSEQTFITTVVSAGFKLLSVSQSD